MSALPSEDRWSGEQYLVWERQNETRHQLLNGYVVAMTGASREHNLITSNINTALNSQLRERPCEVYVSDMRVQVQEQGTYTYPDVVVVCHPPEFRPDGNVDTLLNPTVIIEVLSESTELIDRGVKLAQYRALSSLQDYFLVSQHTLRIERYTRHTNGGWLYTDVMDLEARIKIDSIGCTLALEDVYAKISFDSE